MTLPWKLGLGAVAVLLLTVALLRSCDLAPPIVIPDWADSLRAAHAQYRRDSIQIAAHLHRARAEADSAKRAADSWRQRALVRPARPPRPGTIPPDSGTLTQTNADSIVWLTAQVDSLWAALDASDSAYASLESAYFAEQRRSAAALAGWAAADSNAARQGIIADRAISDLTTRLRKAQRGCRVLGLLPCPALSAGYGATLANGQVRVGPTVGITVAVRF